jgi:hypothetical protein
LIFPTSFVFVEGPFLILNVSDVTLYLPVEYFATLVLALAGFEVADALAATAVV